MIKIILRHANDAEGHHLTDCFISELDQLIGRILRDTMVDDDGNVLFIVDERFIYGTTEAYFEIVVAPESDPHDHIDPRAVAPIMNRPEGMR